MIDILDLLKKRKNREKNNLTITVLPGFNCNLRCKMCYNWQIPKNNSMSSDKWINLIKSLEEYKSQYKSVQVNIGGGEPYLHDYVFDIMTLCKKLGFRSNISTNGSILTKSILKRSIDAGLIGISISLDSLKERTHDKYRGLDGSFKKAIKAIERVHNTGKLELSIVAILMKGNLDDVIPLAKWVANTETIAFNVQAIVEPFQKPPIDKWYDHPDYFELWPRDKEKINQVIDELIYLKNNVFRERMFNSSNQLKLFKNYFFQPDNFIKHKGCSLVDKDAITINPDGSVFICPFMDSIGNIRYSELNKILNSKKSQNIINIMNLCTKNCHHLMNCYYKDEEVNMV